MFFKKLIFKTPYFYLNNAKTITDSLCISKKNNQLNILSITIYPIHFTYFLSKPQNKNHYPTSWLFIVQNQGKPINKNPRLNDIIQTNTTIFQHTKNLFFEWHSFKKNHIDFRIFNKTGTHTQKKIPFNIPFRLLYMGYRERINTFLPIYWTNVVKFVRRTESLRLFLPRECVLEFRVVSLLF